METGYVLLHLEPGTKKDFLARARDIAAIKEARLVIGICDAIAVIEAESIEELEKIYFNKIDNIASVMTAKLHIVACPRARK